MTGMSLCYFVLCSRVAGGREINLVSLPDPGGGWEDFGTPLGFRKIWCKTGLGGEQLGPARPRLKLQSLWHYLSKTMTLCNLAWVTLQNIYKGAY